jgi:hypothetical protein
LIAPYSALVDADVSAIARGACLCAIAAACSESPRGWRVVDDAVDGHLLSAWCDADRTLLAGGRGGRGTVFRSDGSTWETMPGTGPAVLRWIWGSADAAVAVGEDGTVLRLDSGAWTAQFSTLGSDVTLWGAWGSAPDDVWAVGGSLEGGPRGVLMHWDGAVWIPFAAKPETDVNFFKVWGCAPNRAWIVGEAGTILAFDGEAWAPEDAATDADLYTVHGTSDCGRVWAVGLSAGAGRGVLLEREAGGWRVVRDDVQSGLFGVCGDDEEVWVVGARGYAARVTEEGLDEDPAPTDLDLHACHRARGCGTWVVGGDLSGTGSSPTGIAVHRGPRVPSGPLDRMPGDGGAAVDGPTGNGDIGPGQECPTGATASCQPGLRCWYVMDARRFVCTKDCEDAAFCDAEGFPAGCCDRPGTQTTATVCLPASYGACP